MLHLSLNFKNLHPGLKINWSDLRMIVATAKQIYPKLDVEVHTEFAYADSFNVDFDREILEPWAPVKVSLLPMSDVNQHDINPQITSITQRLVHLITWFLGASYPFNDPSTQPSYFPESEIKISAGFGESTYINGVKQSADITIDLGLSKPLLSRDRSQI